MNYDFHKNHFELFGLSPRYQIDLSNLESVYRNIQSQVHPDKFVNASDVERRLSMQMATQANEAFRILKNPLQRANYILQLHGIESLDESNTAMPTDFLVEQMERREAVDAARTALDIAQLERLKKNLTNDIAKLNTKLINEIDIKKNYSAASETVKQLTFLEKLATEIDDAIEVLET